MKGTMHCWPRLLSASLVATRTAPPSLTLWSLRYWRSSSRSVKIENHDKVHFISYQGLQIQCLIIIAYHRPEPRPVQSAPPHTAHQIGALQFQLQKILFGTSQKCRDGQQTLISCTSFQILHLQLAVLFQTKSPMSTFSVSGDRILSHIMPRSADDDTVNSETEILLTFSSNAVELL